MQKVVLVVIFSIVISLNGMVDKRQLEDVSKSASKKVKPLKSNRDIIHQKGLTWFYLSKIVIADEDSFIGQLNPDIIDYILHFIKPEVPNELFSCWALKLHLSCIKLKIDNTEQLLGRPDFKLITTWYPKEIYKEYSCPEMADAINVLLVQYAEKEAVHIEAIKYAFFDLKNYHILVKEIKSGTGPVHTHLMEAHINVYNKNGDLLCTKLVSKESEGWDDGQYFPVNDITIDPSESWISYVVNNEVKVLQLSTLKPLAVCKVSFDCDDYKFPKLKISFNPYDRTELLIHKYKQEGFLGPFVLFGKHKIDLTALDRLEKMVNNPTLEQARLLNIWNDKMYHEAEQLLNRQQILDSKEHMNALRRDLSFDHCKLLGKQALLMDLLNRK